MIHPIDTIQWMPVEQLSANDYNPNRVLTAELKLLKVSLLATGWIQPVLANRERKRFVTTVPIIDGYHRWWLTSNDEECRELTGGKVPVALLELSVPERMMLTIRINRAKGVHQAVAMSSIVKALVNTHGIPKNVVCERIGADMSEVDLLLLDDIFVQKDVKTQPFSQAWVIGKDNGSLYQKK